LIANSVLDADDEENHRINMQWHHEVAKNCLRRLQFSDSCRHDYFLFAQDRRENRRNVNHIVLEIITDEKLLGEHTKTHNIVVLLTK
jgi:hypothetical protein